MLFSNKFTGKVPLYLRDIDINLSDNLFTEIDWDFFREDTGYVPELSDNQLSGLIPEDVLDTERWKRWKLKLGNQKQGYGFNNFNQ